MMLLLIYADLNNRKKLFKKKQTIISIGILILSTVVAFVPLDEYESCKIGDYPLYCGKC